MAGSRQEQDIVLLEYELTAMVRTLEALNRRRHYPLERAHYLLLLQLRDGPLSIGELAQRLLLDNSTVTRQINAMLKKQLIVKIPNPDDGRSALVQHTARGSRLVEDMHQLRIERLQHTLSQWSSADKKRLAELTGRLTRDLTDSVLE